MTPLPSGMRVGVDIGGTFTDLVFTNADQHLDKLKVPSTPDDYSRAIVSGIEKYLSQKNIDGESINEVVHATTVATNAILERKGARTGLITTKGFRDVLELRRIRIPFSYDLNWQKPAPLVDRFLRCEVNERVDAAGNISTPLDKSSLQDAIQQLRDASVTSVAVCLLHSYMNPSHEQEIGETIRNELPDVYVSLSHEVLPEIKEFERTSTTVVNAYVAPLIGHYLDELRENLKRLSVSAPILVMQSNGGLIPSVTASKQPVTIIESGPAAGEIAAAEVARKGNYPNVITLDMGGTTTKASIIEQGEILRAGEYEVGSPVSVSSRLVRGSGYLLRIPVVDISEVGAGGGSIAQVDTAGAVRVGPRSAGADPGPACYGFGNQYPTVTDANLVLGYLNPDSLAGGALKINPSLAEAAVSEHIAKPTGLDVLEAAHGVYTIANSNMVRAIKSVSVERGRDPAEFVLMAFGGAGPLHACDVARSLNITTVIVPPAPGLFSAFGLLEAQVEHHTIRSVVMPTDKLQIPLLQSVFEQMNIEVISRAKQEGFDESTVHCSAFMDIRYLGQSSEITIPLTDFAIDHNLITEATASFEKEFERTYGHRGSSTVFEIVNCRMLARVSRGVAHDHAWDYQDINPAENNSARKIVIDPQTGPINTKIVTRTQLSAEPLSGPIIVEEYDSTTLVPPGWTVHIGKNWNMIINLAVT